MIASADEDRSLGEWILDGEDKDRHSHRVPTAGRYSGHQPLFMKGERYRSINEHLCRTFKTVNN